MGIHEAVPSKGAQLMPGLFGLWAMEGDPVNPETLVGMGETMRHHPGLRTEHAIYPGFGAGCTHLGYLQSSAQFVSDADPFYAVWLDGEICNQDELIRTYGLRQSDVPSDAALVLELWKRIGQDFLANVNGIFSAAVYDRTVHELTLMNDRFGFRPLYWRRADSGFAFAGEVKALLACPGVSVEIDPTAVDEWVSFGYLLGTRTWIKGIHLLPPATIMRVGKSGRTQTSYWSWHDIKQPDSLPGESEIVERLGQLWIAAIRRRVDDKRLGQFLSGGLDSRAILAALPETRRPYHTVTFGKEGCVDEQIARRVARRKGMAHHFVEINARNWLPPRIDAIWRTDGMAKVLDLHGAETLPLFSNLCDVHLHGHLGDATVGGSYLGPENPDAYFKEKIFLANPLSLDRSTALDRLRSAWEADRFPLDRFLINQRGRRYINTGLIMAASFVECRLPFFD